MLLRFSWLLAIASAILFLLPDSPPPARGAAPTGAKVTAELADGSNRVVVVNGTSLSEKAATAEVTAKTVDPAIENECQIKSKTFKWELVGLFWKGGPDDGQPVAKNLYDAKFAQKKPTEPEATFQLRLVKPGRVRAIIQVTACWTIGGKTKENDSCQNTQASDILKAETHNGEPAKGLDFIGVQMKLVAVPKVLAARCKHAIPFYFEYLGAHRVMVNEASANLEIHNVMGRNVPLQFVTTTGFGLLAGDNVRKTPPAQSQNGQTNQYTLLFPPAARIDSLEFAPVPTEKQTDQTSHRNTTLTAWVASTFTVNDLSGQTAKSATTKKVPLDAILDKHIPIVEFGPAAPIMTSEPYIQTSHTAPIATLRYLGNSDGNTRGKKLGFYGPKGWNPKKPSDRKAVDEKKYEHFETPVPLDITRDGPDRAAAPFNVKGPIWMRRPADAGHVDWLDRVDFGIQTYMLDVGFGIAVGRPISFSGVGTYEMMAYCDTKYMKGERANTERLGYRYDKWQAQVSDRQYGVWFVVYFGAKPVTDLAGKTWDDREKSSLRSSVIDISQNRQQLNCVMFEGAEVNLYVADDPQDAKTEWEANKSAIANGLAVAGSATALVGNAGGLAAWKVVGGVFALSGAITKILPSDISLLANNEYSRGRAEMWGFLTINGADGKPLVGYKYPADGKIKGFNDEPNTVTKHFNHPGKSLDATLTIRNEADSLTWWKFLHDSTCTSYVQKGRITDYRAYSQVRFVAPPNQPPMTCTVTTVKIQLGQSAQGFYVGE